MFSSSLVNGGTFLISTLFDLYLMILMVRFILCLIHADYFNPITQFIIKLTKPLIQPLRRVLPMVKRIELATLVVMIVIAAIKFFILGLITVSAPESYLGLLILACANVFKLFINTFFYAIFLQAVLSWIQPGYSPVTQLLLQITSPIMRPIQRVMPLIGGFDLSPIPALIILELIIIIVADPLMALGVGMTYR